MCVEELRALRTFLVHADRVGLPVAGDTPAIRDPRRLEAEILQSDPLHDESPWPPDRILETLALAQHHGVATRLIDFTYEPFVAAFFAAEGVVRGVDEQREGARLRREIIQKFGERCRAEALSVLAEMEAQLADDEFEVWAFDLTFLRNAWAQDANRCRIREVTVPQSGNGYLSAQQGFFLLDGALNLDWHQGDIPALDLAYERFFRSWLGQGETIARSPRDIPLVQVFTAPADSAEEVLDLLARRGISYESIYPSYDNVVQHLKRLGKLT